MPLLVLQNIWWALVLIGVMILIHELGHYWAARFFDVKVDTFSFGFGPRLFGFKKGETDFRVAAIFFGGYVKMAGQEPSDENANDPRGFLSKPRWQRLIISFAGPAMNIVLAVAILTGLFMVRFPKVPSSPSPEVIVMPDSAAAKAGIRDGDRIVQIDGTENPTWEDIGMKEVASPGHELSVWISRDGERKHVAVTPVLDPKTGTGFAGWGEQSEIEVISLPPDKPAAQAGLQVGDTMVSINGQPIRSTPKVHDVINNTGGKPVVIVYSRNGQPHTVTLTPAKTSVEGAEDRWQIGVLLGPRIEFVSLSFPRALVESVRSNEKYATLIYQFLQGILERRMSPKSLEGPIGIARLSGQAAREGPTAYFALTAMVSLNLAVFNLLPIPILDGGVILLLLVEMFMRRDLSVRVKEAVFKLGFVFLMAVVAFVLYNDISKLAG
jgi:regulator of sigma E protease